MGFLEEMIRQTIRQTYFYMEETDRTGSFERFPYLGVLTARGNQGRGAAGEAEAKRTQDGGSAAAKERYLKLLARLGGNDAGNEDIELIDMVVRLCVTAALVPEFAEYLNYYTGNGATLSLACELLGRECPAYAGAAALLKRLRNAFFIDFARIPITLANLEADHALLAYLTGGFGQNPALEGWAKWLDKAERPHAMYVRGELAGSGAKLLAKAGAVQISGRGGRRFLARHIAAELEKDLLLIKAGRLSDCEGEEKLRLVQAVHEAFLREGAVCIYGINERNLQDGWSGAEDFFESVVRVFLEAGIPVLLCTDAGIGFAGENIRIARIELSELNRVEREMVWQGFIEKYALAAESARCAANCCLDASGIARVAARWKECERQGEGVKDEGGESREGIEGIESRLSRLCLEELCKDADKLLGQLIEPSVRFADIAVDSPTRRLLEEIRFGAVEGWRIYEEWNLKEKYPYGRVVSVLLIGPPGTGKTMTAHALAHEIGMPLYQVDLSHIIDKYIGETEKHLEQVFSFAQKSRAVLFFDEADALFGRRGEVTEGKDRYANMEVSYILQRIEQYDGIVLLATNFYSNIDKAFLRRMKYVIKYQAPDEAMRRALWENSLPARLVREELDIPYLARQFELTGGMIKNIIQGACITALYEKRPLNMGHVLAAVRREYEKMERSITREFWGEYGHLMSGNPQK